jgi:hypothetical protein
VSGWSGCFGMCRAGGAVLGREGCVVVGEGGLEGVCLNKKYPLIRTFMKHFFLITEIEDNPVLPVPQRSEHLPVPL